MSVGPDGFTARNSCQIGTYPARAAGRPKREYSRCVFLFGAQKLVIAFGVQKLVIPPACIDNSTLLARSVEPENLHPYKIALISCWCASSHVDGETIFVHEFGHRSLFGAAKPSSWNAQMQISIIQNLCFQPSKGIRIQETSKRPSKTAWYPSSRTPPTFQQNTQHTRPPVS